MTESLISLTEIYNSKGADGLSSKFLQDRKSKEKLQITHEHILDLGDISLRKLDFNQKNDTSVANKAIEQEKNVMGKELELYKHQLKTLYEKRFLEEKQKMKKSYDILMQRIEIQRDEAEEERVKELIKKMNEECEEALRRQWKEAEELKEKAINNLRESIRKQIFVESQANHQLAIKEALDKAEEQYKIREAKAIKKTRDECENETNEKIRKLCERYDQSIELLLEKYHELEEKYIDEKRMHLKFESDFRLLQADYKRFMNYTDHYNSDYMMKLRHVGQDLLNDREYDKKLDEKIELFDVKSFRKLHLLGSKPIHSILN